jgi:hypothetical protein
VTEDLWIDLVLIALVVWLWIEFKLKTSWVIVSVVFLLLTPKDTLGNIWRFLGALDSGILLVAAVLVAFFIGRDWAERHRAQYDSAQASKKAKADQKKYRTPESESDSKAKAK